MVAHARKLLSTVLAAKQTIRDEVYAQLMKQTVKNPRAYVEMRTLATIWCCLRGTFHLQIFTGYS